jgi:hypothetical protein
MARYDPFAIAAFVLALAGLFIFAPFFGGLAIVFGFYALIRLKKNKKLRGRVLAVLGFVLGGVDFVIVLVFNLLRNP